MSHFVRHDIIEFMGKSYWLYILSSNTGTLYVGMTDDLFRRLYEHRNHLIKGFTSHYNIHNLIYYEEFNFPSEAIEAEKKIKKWSRKKKLDLVKSINPNVIDLSEQFNLQISHFVRNDKL